MPERWWRDVYKRQTVDLPKSNAFVILTFFTHESKYVSRGITQEKADFMREITVCLHPFAQMSQCFRHGVFFADTGRIAQGNEIISHMGDPQIPHHGILTIDHDEYTVFKAVKINNTDAFFRQFFSVKGDFFSALWQKGKRQGKQIGLLSAQ